MCIRDSYSSREQCSFCQHSKDNCNCSLSSIGEWVLKVSVFACAVIPVPGFIQDPLSIQFFSVMWVFEGKTGNKGVQEYGGEIASKVGISVSIGIKNRVRIRVRLCKWTVTQDDAKRPWKMFGFHAQGCVHLRHVIQTKSVEEWRLKVCNLQSYSRVKRSILDLKLGVWLIHDTIVFGV